MSVSIKTAREIELMRESCHLLEKVHDELAKAIRPGISTWEIDHLGEEMIRSFGCTPNFLHYNGYPASICVSVNDEVVHGIPSKKRILREGDIVSLDAGLIYKGYHSDAARTHAVVEIICMIFPLRSAIMQKVLDTVLSEIWLVMESDPAFMKIRRSRTLHRSGEESVWCLV